MSKTKLQERSHQLSDSRPEMSPVSPPKSQGLRLLDWRSEILQAMFWLSNEGIGDHVDPALLERFLGVDCRVDGHDLDRLVDEGHVERVGASYTLSEAGTRKARLDFAASFEEFMRPIPAECSRAAWCSLIGASRFRLDT